MTSRVKIGTLGASVVGGLEEKGSAEIEGHTLGLVPILRDATAMTMVPRGCHSLDQRACSRDAT